MNDASIDHALSNVQHAINVCESAWLDALRTNNNARARELEKVRDELVAAEEALRRAARRAWTARNV